MGRRTLAGLGLLAGVAVSGALLGGCGGEGGGASGEDPRILAINASADSGSLIFELNGEDFSKSLTYTSSSGRFTKVPFRDDANDGGYDVGLLPANRSEEFDLQALTFPRDSFNILVAYGNRDFGAEPIKRLQFTTIPVDPTPPIGNRSTIIFFHGFNRGDGDGTPALTLKTPGANPQFSIPNVAYGEVNAATVDAGVNTWIAKRADSEAEYARLTINLEPASVYLAVASGVEGSANATRRPRITFYRLRE